MDHVLATTRFYSDDTMLVQAVSNLVTPALLAGNAAIVLVTKPHRDQIAEALKLQGVNINSAIDRGTYICLDAAETLSMFMLNGWPNRVRFFEGFNNLINAVSNATKTPNPRIAVFGECVRLLCEEGKLEAAICMEQLGNHLANKHDVDILCAYPLDLCTAEQDKYTERRAAHRAAISCG